MAHKPRSEHDSDAQSRFRYAGRDQRASLRKHIVVAIAITVDGDRPVLLDPVVVGVILRREGPGYAGVHVLQRVPGLDVEHQGRFGRLDRSGALARRARAEIEESRWRLRSSD